MEVSKDGTKARRYSYEGWSDLDPKTGLVALDEGLYFHFKESKDGVVCSIRTNRWWGPQVLYSDTFPHITETSPEDILSMSITVERSFRGRRVHQQYKARTVRKDKTQAKYMGSYNKRNVNEVG